ncbi:MAG: hypothetical protein JNG88_07040, partial [Phycisphaerales bacterium]|nr:hypothetical protein [Phycisphaerales bacterium]
ADCATGGGTYQGNFSVCTPNPCPQPTGACCYADGSCQVQTNADCVSGGGTYQGDNSSCDPNPCEQPCTDADRADSNCDGTVNNFDIDCFVFAVVGGTNDPSLWLGFGCQQNGCDFICVNDVNEDLAVDNFDIDTFVSCVINLGCP